MDDKHIIATTAIIVKERRYLITKRALNKKAFPGKWTVPGGRLEINDYIVKSDVKISNDFIDIEVDYPLTIKKGGSSFFIDDFNEKVNIRLGRMINAISEMMIIQMEETRYVCINCNDKIAEENGLLIDMETYDGSEINFNIIDTKSEVKGGAYWFRFVNKYE